MGGQARLRKVLKAPRLLGLLPTCHRPGWCACTPPATTTATHATPRLPPPPPPSADDYVDSVTTYTVLLDYSLRAFIARARTCLRTPSAAVRCFVHLWSSAGVKRETCGSPTGWIALRAALPLPLLLWLVCGVLVTCFHREYIIFPAPRASYPLSLSPPTPTPTGSSPCPCPSFSLSHTGLPSIFFPLPVVLGSSSYVFPMDCLRLIMMCVLCGMSYLVRRSIPCTIPPTHTFFFPGSDQADMVWTGRHAFG